MTSMNAGRILIGGLAAGLLINISEFILNGVVLMEQAEAYMAELDLAYASWAMPVYVLIAFLWGLGMVATYAAVRPRFGPGPKTALLVGIAFWFFAMFLPAINMAALGLAGGGMLPIALVWTLVEACAASLVGARLYAEAHAPATAGAPA
jgi:hypothetical protein